MQYSIIVHEHARRDLDELWQRDEDAAALIEVLLEDLDGDQALLDSLTIHKYERKQDPRFEVSKWFEQWNQRRDLWRLRPFYEPGDGPPYRVIYAYVPARRQYAVLAIAPREFDYDASHPLARRIIADYGDL